MLMWSAVRRSSSPLSNSRRSSLNPRSDTNRPHRRPISYTEPRAAADSTETHITDAIVDVSGVEESDQTEIRGHGHPQFSIENDHRVPTFREPVLVNRYIVAQSIQREAAHCLCPPPEKKAFADWQGWIRRVDLESLHRPVTGS